MRLVPIALLMIVSISAWADWTKAAENDEAIYYLEPTTLQKHGPLRRVWVMHDLKTRDKYGHLSIKFLEEFDCQEERWRYLSASGHSGPTGSGTTLTSASETSEWSFAPPDSSARRLLKAVCSGKPIDIRD